MSIKLLKIRREDEAKQQQQQQKQQVLKNGEAQVVADAASAAGATSAGWPAATTRGHTTTGTTATTTRSASSPSAEDGHYEAPLVWKNIFLFIVLHSCIPAALILLADPQRRPQWRTIAWAVFGMYASGLGVTGGAHRLWSHKAYKARPSVQVFLMLLQTMAGQNSIYTWCRDHRVHHKFSETHADPHNIKRGFFFAHMGWLCCRKHPDVRSKGALIDMTDLEANPVVMYQHRNFWWLATLFTVVLPMMLPVWLWQEQLWTSFIFSFMIRYLFTLHGTWLVNSAAHYYGSQPYDNRIEARESPMVILYGLGEGFHNYHHTFPFDYSTSEFGKFFNITTAFIDLCASLGLVYDRRKIDKETILRRRRRTGNCADDAAATAAAASAAARAEQWNNGESNTATDDVTGRAGGRPTRAGLAKVEAAGDGGELVSSSLSMDIIHELPYISGLTSMKYTM